MVLMDFETLALSTWDKFTSLEGSAHIATPLALKAVADWCMSNKPKQFVDVGAGIGTFSYLASRLKEAPRLIALEENDWCRERLSQNLADSRSPLTVVRTVEELLSQIHESGGILVIDSKVTRLETLRLLTILRPDAVFVEGLRRRQCLDVAISLREIKHYLSPRLFLKDSTSVKGGTLFSTRPPALLGPIAALLSIFLFYFLTAIAENLSRVVSIFRK